MKDDQFWAALVTASSRKKTFSPSRKSSCNHNRIHCIRRIARVSWSFGKMHALAKRGYNVTRSIVLVLILCMLSTSLLLHMNDIARRVIHRKKASDASQTKLWKDFSIPVSTSSARLYGVLINVQGSFLDRVRQFNSELNAIRNELISERDGGGKNTSQSNLGDWNDTVLHVDGARRKTIWGAQDNYWDILATRHRHIRTIALEWQRTTANATESFDPSHHRHHHTEWSSLADFSNVLIQRYYGWSATDDLCGIIETRKITNIVRYYTVHNGTCNRNQVSAAARSRPLRPVVLNDKPVHENHYWPNHGTSYPGHFYTDTPPFMFHMHVHHDAVVNDIGHVFSGDTSLMLYQCYPLVYKPRARFPENAAQLPIFDEVLTIAQVNGIGYYHRMAEVIPRIVMYIDFLRANPNVKIQMRGTREDKLTGLFRLFGLNKRRVVYGSVRAKILYQPRATMCVFANVQESQLASKLYRDYIARTFRDRRLPRNRLILTQRSNTRIFTEQEKIESLLKSTADEFGLTYELFPDDPSPSLTDTLRLFNAAVLVVGPHGAGLSNMIFSEPGTFVVEGVCHAPYMSLCFQRLAHVLGHRWHGILSHGGCEEEVDVSADSINDAVRTFLRIWNTTHEAERQL